jgi:predicted nucleic acid-binding protein
MKAVFCDTFFFLAAINQSDKCHEEALAWSNAYDGPLLTTIWVITEVADALAGRQDRQMFEIFYQTLQADKRMHIVTAQQPHWERGLTLYFQRPDKKWSLTDCISFVVMDDEELTDALTGDRYFEQAGFTVLLRKDDA